MSHLRRKLRSVPLLECPVQGRKEGSSEDVAWDRCGGIVLGQHPLQVRRHCEEQSKGGVSEAKVLALPMYVQMLFETFLCYIIIIDSHLPWRGRYQVPLNSVTGR